MKRIVSLVLLTASCLLPPSAWTQALVKEPRTVAIFLYQDVELLDFAGPGEVFSASGFKTYTVSVDGKKIMSQRFVDIQPQYSIENAPAADIIVFPGGNAGPSANDPRVIQWIQSSKEKGVSFMSVCTGAFILAKAGLLDGKRATTHWGSVKNLSSRYPQTTVLEDTRWVDNGIVITTAGVSAGIDGALHYVARIKGLEVAKNTARYMEYDKWDPENGVVDAKNEYLTKLTDSYQRNADAASVSPGNNANALTIPFHGEFINAVDEEIHKGENARAAFIIHDALKYYPDSQPLYNRLGEVNRKIGKPAPIAEDELVRMVRNGEVDRAIKLIESEKKSFPGWKIFSENEMKDAAYYLLERKDYKGAITIFKLNTSEFPTSADTFDSLGEAYLAAGRREEGIKNYKIAASMGFENAKKVLRDLGAQ